MSRGQLFYGDCLEVIASLPPASVDLAYLDPPFNSDRQYNAIYTDATGRPLPTQIEAFCDTWTLDAEQERAIRTIPVLMREAGVDDDTATFWKHWMNALRHTQPRLLAYLAYMVQRLIRLRFALTPTASVYLHCDPTASHYIKVMLDAIFGHQNFQSEVIWKRVTAHSRARRWGPVHDVLLHYTMSSDAWTWNPVHQAYDDAYIDDKYRHDDGDGRGPYRLSSLEGAGTTKGPSGQPWRGIDPTDIGRHWAVPMRTTLPDWAALPGDYETLDVQQRLDALDAAGLIYWPTTGRHRKPNYKRYLTVAPGMPLQDVITDISPINPAAKERLGYPTQKPVALLERIIEASCPPDGLVLDPFCGCASTIEAAHNLGREWIGIDIAIHAIKRVAKQRLEDRLGLVEGEDFTITGIPNSFEGALDLWERDKYHFQKWAVEEIDGFVTTKQSADGGIDGRIYFPLAADAPQLDSMAVEVKGGRNVGIAVLRELLGVLDNDQAVMAGLIVLHTPSERQGRSFRSFMAQAGTLEAEGRKFDRMQMLTVTEILDGNRFDTPAASARGLAKPVIPGLKLPPKSQAPNL